MTLRTLKRTVLLRGRHSPTVTMSPIWTSLQRHHRYLSGSELPVFTLGFARRRRHLPCVTLPRDTAPEATSDTAGCEARRL